MARKASQMGNLFKWVKIEFYFKGWDRIKAKVDYGVVEG